MSQNALSLLSEELQAYLFYILIFQVKYSYNSPSLRILQTKTYILSYSFSSLTTNSGFMVGREERNLRRPGVQFRR